MAGKRPYRWDHLNDFRSDGSGGYVYGGNTYVYDGTPRDRRRYLAFVAAGAAAALVLAVIPECMPPVPMSRSFITVLPWLAESICVFLLCWSSVRLLFRAGELREYIYRATVPRIPRRLLATAVCSFAAAAAQIAYIAVFGFEGNAVFLLARPLCSLASGISCLLFRTAIKDCRWITK